MLSSSKVSFFGGHFGEVCPLEDSQIWSKQLSHKYLPIVRFKFLCCAVQKFVLGDLPLGGTPNLVKIIVSHTTSYIVSFNFLCQAVQNDLFFGPHFGGSPLSWSLKTICKQTPIGLHVHQLSDFYIKRSMKS